MSFLLAAAAIVTVAGALVAITGRDARIALVGLVVALAAAPFLADPLPGPAALGARVVAALLGGYLLWIVLRETTAITRGSLVGLPAETLAAAAAFVIGYGTSGLGSAPLGPDAASAAGFALVVIAAGPIARGADVFRLGVALAILVTGAELIRVGLAGTPSPLEQLMTAGLTIGLLGTAAVLCVNAVSATGGLALRNEPRRSALFEAHPVTPTAPSSLRPAWLPRRPGRSRHDERPTEIRRLEAAARDHATGTQAEIWPAASDPTGGDATKRDATDGDATGAPPLEARGLADLPMEPLEPRGPVTPAGETPRAPDGAAPSPNEDDSDPGSPDL